jgi:copper homeostasis protein (lipoprotein)
MACRNAPAVHRHCPAFAVTRLLRLLVLLSSAVSLHGVAATGEITYAGTSPCIDGAAQEVVVTLFADGSFRMRTRVLDAPLGSAEPLYDIGRWERDDRARLVLRGGREAPVLFAPSVDGWLRPLDHLGRPIDAQRRPTLQRQAELQRLGGPMRLRGMYQFLADAALLTECRTGRRWPVLIDGGHLALERAYLAHRAQGGGERVLAAFTGGFVPSEPQPGLLPREFIRVESFERLWPGESCAADAPATAALLNTLWRLVEIDGQPVTVAPGRRGPWLQLSNEGNRVRGQTGCRALSGSLRAGQ